MKTTQLLDLLTKKEKGDFLVVIISSKRKETQKLAHFLLNDKKRERSDIFKAVFGKTYQVKKDYLLRNEFRLLNQHLENFIAHKHLTTKEKRLLFLKAIQKSGLNDLFDKEIKKEINKCQKDDDFEGLAKLHQLIIDKHLSHKKFTHANLQKMMALNEQIIFFQKKAALYDQREALVTKAFLTKNLHLSSEVLGFNEIEDIPKKHDDAYLQYLKKKALSYVRPSPEKQIILQETLALIDQVNYYDFDKNAAKIAALNNLALDFFLSFDYQNSIKAYEQLLEISNLSGSLRDFVLFNYLNCLLKAEEYQKSITIIEQHFSTPNTSPLLSGKLSCIKAMARVFTGELELAYMELSPHSKKDLRNNYFYSRLVLTIIFYLEQNIDLAKREIENILQIIPDTDELHYLLFCAKSFRTFLTLEDQFKDNSLKRERLFSSIDSFIHVDNKGSDILPLLWLKKWLLDHA